MKKLTTLLALAVFSVGCATYPTIAQAGGTSFVGYAKVVNVEEVYRNVQTRTRHTDCHTDYHNSSTYHNGDHNASNEILGAIIGGVIGNQIGNHDAGATAVGAILGGVVAGNMESGHTHNTGIVPQEHCTSHYHTNSAPSHQISHYRVTLSYAGETFTIRQNWKPPFNHQKIVVTVSIQRH
jgi:uncharacterized protein YcfJ